MSDFSLEDRVVMLTGASGHLGQAIAHGLAHARAEIVLCGRRAKPLADLAERLGAIGARAHPLVFDLTKDSEIQRAVDWVATRFGRIDGIVNNAYSGRAGAMDRITAADFESACAQNLFAPFRLVWLSLPLLEQAAGKKLGGASIVNVASMYGSVSPDPRIYGDSGQNNPVHYGAMKAGMIQMSRYLACHLAEKGIRVNAVAPGAFPRPDLAETAPDFLRRLEGKMPMGRIGRPEEVAGPVVFLLSGASSYVTGVNLPVDGGWTAW